MKNIIYIFFLFLLCADATHAQSSYYYKGKKTPLIDHNNKVCVSIPKDKSDKSDDILKNVKVIDRIDDPNYDIFIIPKSDQRRLFASISSSLNLETYQILFSPCFNTLDGSEVFSTPYLNVRLKKEQDINLLFEYAERYSLKIVKRDSLMPMWFILSVTPGTGKNAVDLANMLWDSGLFSASVPDLCSHDILCSNDPYFNLQWGLHNENYSGIDISATSAWAYATGKNVKIAFIDSGVDLNQIDLAPNISSLSYDTETGTSPSVVYEAHATHCAGIAAAVKDNGIQVAGVSPDATIISISTTMSDLSTNLQLKLADGFIWAYQHDADIISNSWHCSTAHEAIDEAIHDAFHYGRQGKGCVIVFAAGNLGQSQINYPANCNDTILAVGSIDRTGVKASGSNYGTGLDIVAPGVEILSTMPNDALGYGTGTSMACPHVAGVAALILERNSELTVNQVNSIINSNAKKLSGVNFNVTKPDGLWNNEYGYGLVDAYNSVINTPSTVYIQNDTITGSRVISAESIYVGRDVTNTQAYGDVTLGQGDITLKAKNVVVKNSMTVPLGTILKIGPY